MPSSYGTHILRALVTGVILMILVFALGGYFPGLTEALIWPGVLVASVFGYGAHDAPLYLLAFLFDSLIYGAFFYGLFVLIRVART